MRWTSRLLATAKTARFLEPNTPTGLTGLFTHAAPRSTLIYLYSSTLEKLKEFPESSVYRQSTEALTSHRLKIISSIEPEGLKEWQTGFNAILKEHPDVFTTPASGVSHDNDRHVKEVINGRTFIHTKVDKDYDDTRDEWDGEEDLGPELEGSRSTAERAGQSVLGNERPGSDSGKFVWDGQEPPLNADQ
jgi:NADH dehydrogenase (ubiquinone) 1 alpha subcomplex subunit 5